MTGNITVAAAAGVLLGGLYFGGLWHTVQRLHTARRPEILLLTGYVVRMAVLAAGIWWVGAGQWTRLAACLAGVLFARTAACRLARRTVPEQKGEGYGTDA